MELAKKLPFTSPSPTVLVVEDDESSRFLLARLLNIKFPHLNIVFAVDGEDGLAQFSHHHCDVVITDINMPRMDGTTMMMQLRKLRSGLKIIAVTGNQREAAWTSILDSGLADRLIFKPLSHAQLFEAIQHCINADENCGAVAG